MTLYGIRVENVPYVTLVVVLLIFAGVVWSVWYSNRSLNPPRRK
jgi:hypothetical protein